MSKVDVTAEFAVYANMPPLEDNELNQDGYSYEVEQDEAVLRFYPLDGKAASLDRLCQPLSYYAGYKATRELFELVPGQAGDNAERPHLRIPTAASLNRFAAERLQPLGATSLQFVYAAGPDGNDEFTSWQILTGFLHNRFLISTDLQLLLHDTAEHALAQAMLPDRTTNTLRALARHAGRLRTREPAIADGFALNIIYAMEDAVHVDRALERPHAFYRNYRVLSELLHFGERLDRRGHDGDAIIGATRMFLHGCGLKVHGSEVDWEHETLPSYYEVLRNELKLKSRQTVPRQGSQMRFSDSNL